MVDVASLVLAVVSLVGVIGAAALTGWFTLYSDHRKRLSESKIIVAKYRDPLLLAASDLRSRLYNIVDQNVLSYYHVPGQKYKDMLVLYTCFLIGQYFSWTTILRRQAQFLSFSTDKENKQLSDALGKISEIFSTDSRYGHDQPFLLWRGQQLAIGEVMTVKEDGELVCLGYAAFVTKWEDQAFRTWFEPVSAGIMELVEARVNASAADRLRHLQHALVDLIAVLDPKKLKSGDYPRGYCRRSPRCDCRDCKAAPSAPDSHPSSRRFFSRLQQSLV